jgi:hypothetical protein
MQQEFLKKYFPIGKTNQIRKAIIGFLQFEREQLRETWERLKDFLRKCLHHAVPKWQLMWSFVYQNIPIINLPLAIGRILVVRWTVDPK